MTIFQISPYAAKAIVQHVWTGSGLLIYLTFRFPMDQSNTPDRTLFAVLVDAVPKAVFTVLWLDAYTLRLTIGGIGALPTLITVEYLGPDPDLATTWDKQWEPWGPIPSVLFPVVGLSATYTFGGGATGDIATMTFSGGVLIAVTLVP